MPEQIGLDAVFNTSAFKTGLSEYTSGLNKASGLTSSIASGLGSALSTGLTIAAGAFIAIGTAAVVAAGVVAGAITSMVMNAAALGEEYQQMAEQTDLSATRLQELAYAGSKLDTPLETITSGLRFLVRAMYAAQNGTQLDVDAFKELGVSFVDSTGHLRDQNVVFAEVIDALGKVENPAERDALVMKLMGRSAMELNPLIKAGSGLLATYSKEAEYMGAVVSDKSIAALDDFKNTLDATKLAIKGISASIAMTFLPSFDLALGDITNFIAGFYSAWVTAGGSMPEFAQNVKLLVVDTMKSFTKYSIPLMTKNIKDLIKKGTKIIVTQAPDLIKAGGELLTALLKGFADNIPDLMASGLQIASTLYNAIQAAMPSILQAGGDIINALGQGILSALHTLPSVDTIISNIFQAGIDLTAKLKGWIDKIDWDGLATAIVTTLQSIDWVKKKDQITQMITNLEGAIIDFIKKFPWAAIGAEVFNIAVDINLLPKFGKFNIVLPQTIETGHGPVQVPLSVTFVPDPNTSMIPKTWKEFFEGTGTYKQIENEHGVWVTVPIYIQDLDWYKRYSDWAWSLNVPEKLSTLWQQILTLSPTNITGTPEILNLLFPGATPKAMDEWLNDHLWGPISTWFTSIGPNVATLGTQFANWFSTAFTTAWNTFMVWVKQKITDFGNWVSTEIARLVGLLTGTTPKTPTTPGKGGAENNNGGGSKGTAAANLVPIIGATYYGGNPTSNNTRTVTNNITVNNPIAEPASTSIDRSLRKLSYLGSL